MSLKISFESDIRGFERVQRALESQEKILNQNAEAVERLQKAQSGLTSQAMDIKGMESLKGTQTQIKNLTESLDTLASKRNGLKGFMSIFSEFGKEVKKLNTESSVNIFKNMTSQVDALRNSMAGTSQLIKNLRQEIDQAQAAGKGRIVEEKTEKLNELTTKQMSEHQMLSELQRSMLWRGPMFAAQGQVPGGNGGMAGFFGGGTSFQRLGMIGGGMLAGGMAAYKASQQGLAFLEEGMRGEETAFEREKAIARAAMSGRTGRMGMLAQGIGEEAQLRQGGLVTDQDGNFNLRQALRMLKISAKSLVPGYSTEQAFNDESNRLAALDARKIFAKDEATQYEMTLARDQRMMLAEKQYGYGVSRGVLQRMRAQGIADEQGIEALSGLAAQGYVFSSNESQERRRAQIASLNLLKEQRNKIPEPGKTTDGLLGIFMPGPVSKAMELARAKKIADLDEQIKQQEEELEKNPETDSLSDKILGKIAKRSESLLIKDRTQLYRRLRYRQQQGIGMNAAGNEYFEDLMQMRGNLGANRNTPAEVIMQMTQYAQRLQANVVGSDPSLTALTQTATMARGAIDSHGQASTILPPERFQMSARIQDTLQAQVGREGGSTNMAVDMALVNLGITDFGDRYMITQLITQGQPDKAAELAARLLGSQNPTDPNDPTVKRVKLALNMADQQTKRIRDRIFGVTEKSKAIYDAANLDKTQGIMTGDMSRATAVEGDATRQSRIFNVDETGAPVSAKAPFRDYFKPSVENFDKGSATMQQQLTQSLQQVHGVIGDKLAEAVGREVLAGFESMTENLRESVGLFKSMQTPGQEQGIIETPNPVLGPGKNKNEGD